MSKASTHDCGVGIYLYYIRCQYQIIGESLDMTCGASMNHLMDTESDFAHWDPSKAHILVSTPVTLSEHVQLKRWLPQKPSRNFTVKGMSMSCLDRPRTANSGYRKITVKSHSNPSLIYNSNIDPDHVRAGLGLPTP